MLVFKILYSIGHPIFLLIKYLFLFIRSLFYSLAYSFKEFERLIKKIFKQKLFSLFLKTFYLKFLNTKKKIFYTALILILGFIILDIYYLYLFFRSLPSASLLKIRTPAQTTKIYDRNGELLYKIYNQKENRTLVSLSEIPDYLKKATLAIEDKDFYKHGALSFEGIIRALHKNIKGEKQGGSTITQQLVKNVLLSPERTIERKIKEILISIQVEMIFSKDEILNMYFNEVNFGGTAYGVEEASQVYFGKKVSSLNLAEAALLAGLPAAPTYYSPFGAEPKRALKRQKEVLLRMKEEGFISETEYQKALKTKIKFKSPKIDILAPHFVMFVKDLLVKKFGEQRVEQGGLSVITSLDLKLQKEVQKIITEEVKKQKYLNVNNGAALVINPQTGEILGMVGSVNYFDQKNDGNVNIVLMPRQPGSAIKPINYALAFELKKITPSSLILDAPVVFKENYTEPYAPQNYDGRFRGLVTVRLALGSSLNVPAVKILKGVGVDKMIDFGKVAGITTWEDKNRFGLSLTLGSGEVKMIDLVKAYSIFPNYGKKVSLNPILKIFDHKGNLIFEKENIYSYPQVLSTGAAFLINHILADNFARSLVFGYNSPLSFTNQTVSVKTGTTENKKDNWTIGYTKKYLTAVWIGNNDSSPMSPFLESGISGAAPIWRKIMDLLLKNEKNSPWEVPEDIVKVEICKENGLLPCGSCSRVSEYYLKGTEPKNNCNLFTGEKK